MSSNEFFVLWRLVIRDTEASKQVTSVVGKACPKSP
jgi:hypothetical protein